MIFLDVACFFRGQRKDKTIEILESYDLGAGIRLHGLIEKSLVFIFEYNTIQMHDLIQDMGRYVVKMQKDSGKPTRLWNIEDFEDVMVNNTGTMAMEAIWFSYSEKLCFSKEAIKNMQRLRILCMHGYLGFSSQCDSEENDGSIEYLSNNLCWFVWYHYPYKLLPQNFNPTRLVHLNLYGSSLHHLWNEIKQLLYLRKLDLNYSKSLKRTPDFTGMPNLEYLDLSKCTSLEEVHHSLSCCRKLIELNLNYCISLQRFPYVNVESLQSRHLQFCYSLEKLPEFLHKFPHLNVESLNLECCGSLEKPPEILGIMKPELVIKMAASGIREIPSSIILLQWAHLTGLDFSEMRNLVSLRSSICKLKDLVKLDVPWCSKLESFPKEIGDLEKLEELDARHTLISRPPSSIVRLNKLKLLTFAKYKSADRSVYFVFHRVNEGLCSLEELNLSYCNLIDGGLPEDIGSLSSLKELDLSGNNFEHFPQSIDQLGALRSLSLSDCKRLAQLPEFPQQLDTIDADWSNDSICN